MKSIHYLNQAALDGISQYVNFRAVDDNGKPVIRAYALNDVDDFSDDMRRLLEVNKNRTTGTPASNDQRLPALIMSMRSLTDDPLQNVPYNAKFKYYHITSGGGRSFGKYRLVELMFSCRAYFTTTFQAMDFLESITLYEDTNFVSNYRIPGINDDASMEPLIANINLRAANQIQKLSALDDKGQVFVVKFDAQVRGLLLDLPAPAPTILRAELDVFNWSTENLVTPSDRAASSFGGVTILPSGNVNKP